MWQKSKQKGANVKSISAKSVILIGGLSLKLPIKNVLKASQGYAVVHSHTMCVLSHICSCENAYICSALGSFYF